MQRPRREPKESAAGTRPQSTTQLVDVIVLTTDSALLATLREASGPSHQLLHAQSADAAVELLVSGHHGILVIDVAVVGHDVANLIDKLQAQFPEILLLATGRRDEQNAVVNLIGSGRIYRFLHKPISPARAELFLTAATRRYREIHSQASRSALIARQLKFVPPRSWILGVVAIALVACGAWLWSQRRAPRMASPVVAEQSQSPDVSVSSLLSQADAARAAGRLTPPGPNNAFDAYRYALQIDPGNPVALAAIADLTATVEQQVTASLASRNPEATERALAAFKAIAPEHPRLKSLQASFTTLTRKQTRAVNSAAPAAMPAAAASVPASSRGNKNVELAKAYLSAKQLLEPSDANALGQLRRARAAGEDASAIQIAATDLGTQLLNLALAAVEARDVAQARAAHASAVAVDREFETSLPDLELVESRIRALQESERDAALTARVSQVAKLRMSGQLLEPAGNNAYESLQSLIKEAPDANEVKNEQQHLSFALLERTRTALAAGDVDGADVLATRAEATLAGLPQTRTLRAQIGAARMQREDAGALAQAARLPRRHEVAAVYPRDALLNEIEGWVDLEFTIDVEGVPQDVVVKGAQPARVFNDAALFALRQWRFEPVVREGAPHAQRATLRMEFKLQD